MNLGKNKIRVALLLVVASFFVADAISCFVSRTIASETSEVGDNGFYSRGDEDEEVDWEENVQEDRVEKETLSDDVKASENKAPEEKEKNGPNIVLRFIVALIAIFLLELDKPGEIIAAIAICLFFDSCAFWLIFVLILLFRED